MSEILKIILKILFPNHCIGCNQIIDSNANFCVNCFDELEFISQPKCKICSTPFQKNDHQINSTCLSCLKNPPAYDFLISVFSYNQKIKQIIKNLKYHDQTYLANKFAKIIHKKFEEEKIEFDLACITPLHKRRIIKRKFNQVALIAKEFFKIIKSRNLYLDLLLKTKETKSQVGLSKKQRLKNLKYVFKLKEKHKKIVNQKNILLIDDVATTGATIENCAKILKKNGAKKVFVITIARTKLN